MMQGMPQPAFYMMMCSVERPPSFPRPSCINEARRDLFQYMGQQLMSKGIVQTVVPVQTGCLNRCNMGPVLLVEPGHTMYVGLDKEKIDRIIDEHILGGKVVDELTIPAEAWGEAITPEKMRQMSGMA